MVLSLDGLYPPIPTPFTASGDIDKAALASNLQVWNTFDLAGYVGILFSWLS
jgi:dihydrodipicolinate synthase/N-acetylneuraminate lyase